MKCRSHTRDKVEVNLSRLVLADHDGADLASVLAGDTAHDQRVPGRAAHRDEELSATNSLS